jgi:hypothetical protein
VTVHSFDNLDPATTYYWRVRDSCRFGNGPFSPVFTFTTGSNGVMLSAPSLITPSNGATGVGGTVNFAWTDIGDTYTGYVRAINSYAYGADSEHWSFSTGTLQAARPRATAAGPSTSERWLRDAERLLEPCKTRQPRHHAGAALFLEGCST